MTSALAADGTRVHDTELDLAAPGAPEQLITAAADQLGHVDILICNHARSGGDGPLGTLDAAMLDAHWAVNTRSAILLAQAFAAQHDGRPGGRVIFMISGQDLGPDDRRDRLRRQQRGTRPLRLTSKPHRAGGVQTVTIRIVK